MVYVLLIIIIILIDCEPFCFSLGHILQMVLVVATFLF